MGLLFRAALAALVAALLLAAPAHAADPGRWTLKKVSDIPLSYYQGVTNDPARQFFFSGHVSIHRTDSALNNTASNQLVIPPEVNAAEGYNHIGDLSWDRGEGGRLLLPMECYYPGTPNGGNTCPRTGEIGTGAIAVADPKTMLWRYYVKLDQAEIKKAMWVEVTPDGRSFWTQDGKDLLRYELAQIAPANQTTVGPAGPMGPAIKPVQRLRNAVPPPGITGAVFIAGRLFTAGQEGETFQIWSTDLATGNRRLELERKIIGEAEGLTYVSALGGQLHWQIMPYNEGQRPTYGESHGVLLTFASKVPIGSGGTPTSRPRPGTRVRVRLYWQSRATMRRRGLRVRVHCSRACNVRLRATMRGLKGTFASGRTSLRRAGSKVIRIRITKAGKRKLRTVKRPRIRVRATAV
jgi:hypothetical protein